MPRLLSPTLREGFIRWATRRQSTSNLSIEIDRKRIFILPSRNGLIFGLVLLVMLMGSIHYSNSLAFLMTFLLAGLFGIAMWHTHRNLLGLTISKAVPGPVFYGDTAQLPLLIQNHSGRPRIALTLQWQREELTIIDVEAESESTAILRITTRQRGWMKPGRFRLYTRFPLGLFQAWTWLEFDWSILVYPKPIDCQLPRHSTGTGNEKTANDVEGSEDFMGLRDYRHGDSLRHIAWKALAHNEQPLTKQFSAGFQQELWLDWNDIEASDPELRLSKLCHQVLQANANQLEYGLRLPGESIPPNHGEAHKSRCLKMLALYDV